MGKAFAQLELYVLLHQQKGHWVDTRFDEFLELKANAECRRIETDSPVPPNEQLMFEATGSSNKGHVYGFYSKFIAITAEQQGGSSSWSSVSLVSCATAQESYIEREKRLWRYMQKAQD
ncbi:hypothetical protein M9H77_12871 [Catharanthus roseus]|uniref:Uncharacterized protein n=1 Tax=Catharanthus roseus TaxID=4058 RepID=A0ACC0BIU0_CATRO|nr:hypothetical protein M9H77_12871 [Catharanthus roseus]